MQDERPGIALKIAYPFILVYYIFTFFVSCLLERAQDYLIKNADRVKIKKCRDGKIVSFSIDRVPHKIFVPRTLRKVDIIEAKSESGENVLEKIAPFMGPNKDFFSKGISPKNLGYKSISIRRIGGDTKIFNERDSLK